MRSLALLGAMVVAALALAACDDGSGFGAGSPPGGGGTGGMTTRPDAGPDGDAGDPTTISGFVCEVADVRRVDGCVRVNQAGLVVAIDGTPAKTATDVQGRFSLPAQEGAQAAVLTVTDPNLGGFYPGAKRVVLGATGNAGGVTLPVIDRILYEDILITSNVAVAPGNGVVVVHVIRQGVPLAGALVGPLGGSEALYDAADDPLLFTAAPPTTATGMAIWFDVPPSASRTYTVTVDDDPPLTYRTAVVADALLFTTAIVPAN